MGLTRSELIAVKKKITAEMLRRNGKGSSDRLYTPDPPFGSMEKYGGPEYEFTHTPSKDGKIYSEYGEKTVDLLLKIKDYEGLEPTKEGEPIPKGFNSNLITIVDELSKEKFTGETAATIAARKAAGEVVTGMEPESSSCKSACSGGCVGSCIGQCNGCLHTCTADCGVGCNAGSMVSAK